MSAVFNFQSLLTVVLLMICLCTYLKAWIPGTLEAHKTGTRGIFWKFSRIGERLSPVVSLALVTMAFNILYGSK